MKITTFGSVEGKTESEAAKVIEENENGRKIDGNEMEADRGGEVPV